MRVLSKAALTAALTLPLVAALAAPAAATTAVGPFDCPGGEPVCVYLSGSFPISNPVVVPGTGVNARYLQGPRVCDATGANCIGTWIGVPGTWVESTGGTLGTLDVPGIGVGVSKTGVVTVYATTLPTFTPTGGGLGITASVTTWDFPVLVTMNGIDYLCGNMGDQTVGPVTQDDTGCAMTVTVSV